MEIGRLFLEHPSYSNQKTKIGRSALRLLVVASAFSSVLLAWTQPDFRTFSDHAMSTDAMQAELERYTAST